MARPELHIRPAQARAIIAHIELTGCLIDAASLSAEGFQDTGDMPFVEVFITANALALVPGNLRHFSPLVEKGSGIYTPAQFIEIFFPET